MKLLQGSMKLVGMGAGTKRGHAKEDRNRVVQKVARVLFRMPEHGSTPCQTGCISLRSGPYADRDCLLSARSPVCRRSRHSLSDKYNYGWPMTSQKDLLQENLFHVLFFFSVAHL